MSNLPPKPEFDPYYPPKSPSRSRPSEPYSRGRNDGFVPRSPSRPRYHESDRYLTRPREPPRQNGYASRPEPPRRGNREWETRDDRPQGRGPRDYDDRRREYNRPPPPNDRYARDWRTRDDDRPYRRDDARFAHAQDRRDRPSHERSYYERDGRLDRERDGRSDRRRAYGSDRDDAGRGWQGRSRSRSPRPPVRRGPPRPYMRSRSRSRGRAYSSASSARHTSRDRSPEKDRREARSPPRRGHSRTPSPRRVRSPSPQHDRKADTNRAGEPGPSHATRRTATPEVPRESPPSAGPPDHAPTSTSAVHSSVSPGSRTPEPVHSREKGKGKEESSVPDSDVQMEELPSKPSAQPAEPAHAPPTGPRGSVVVPAEHQAHAPLPAKDAATPDAFKPEEPREFPPIPVPRPQPNEAQLFAESKTAEIASLQAQRANAFTLYNQHVKAARRAQHEYEMGALELQAAEQRHAIAEEQEQLAKAGALGIDYVPPPAPAESKQAAMAM